ncbi:hypothetical protein [Sphingomonas adhaesiva]|uniref:hypothetical protein n=1 Tax=Sphingomonas adhaesiva TaxID=28212 RepID=UPI002FFD3DBE
MPTYRDTLISMRASLLAQTRAIAVCEQQAPSPEARRHLAKARASVAAAEQLITAALRAPIVPPIEQLPRAASTRTGAGTW